MTPVAPGSTGWTPDAALFAARLLTALATLGLLAAGSVLARVGRAATLRRTRDALLLALGLSGWLGWWGYFAFPVLDRVHEHDAFHYYVGAKYFPELGYDGIYLCTLQADVEAGAAAAAPAGRDTSRIRDLTTNDLVRETVAADAAAACRSRFAPARWRAFAADVAWFRARLAPEEWRAIRLDHGFNGSPVWLLVANGLIRALAPEAASFLTLARVDYVLLVAMWGAVVLAFGWRAACVAAVFWGTNGFGILDWTGGSLLRQDFLVTLVLGVAALRRGWPALAGALLAASTLLRVFPGVALAALALAAAQEAWRARRLRPRPAHVRFAAGCALACALLLPAATWRYGAEAWREFAANSRKHLATPLLNEMGLRTVLSYAPERRARVMEDPQADDPLVRWKHAQREQAARRGWQIALAGALYLALLWRALAGLEDWAVVALGTGAIPVATHLTCYYHASLLGLALLVARSTSVGIAVLALAAASQWLWAKNPYADVPFVWMSAVELLTVLAATALVAARRRAEHGAAPLP